jgi:hypothetical protein
VGPDGDGRVGPERDDPVGPDGDGRVGPQEDDP